MGRPLRRWDHVRAALLAAVIGLQGLAALPLPSRISEKDLANPVVKEELERWVDLINGLGVSMTEAQLLALIDPPTELAKEVRSTLVAPIKPVNRLLGIQQGWGVFGTPDTWPHALVIEGRVGPGHPRRTLYRSLDPEHRWSRDLLRFRRVRALYAPGNNRPPGWNGFASWIAERAFRDHPDLNDIWVFAERSHVTLPGEAPDSTVLVRFSQRERRE